MVIRRKNNKKAYECNDYKKYGPKRCKVHEVPEEDMWFQFKEFLKATRIVYFNKINEIKVSCCQKNKQNNKKKLQQELEQINLEYKILLQQKIKDLSAIVNIEQRELIIDTYTKLEKEKLDTIIKLKKMLEKQEEQLIAEKIENIKTAINYFDEIINCKEPNRAMLEYIIDTVWIYHDKTVKFDLKTNINLLT